jgi:hypothetical protein
MKPYETERFVREKLGKMFGTRFRRAKLITGYDSGKRPQLHEFDIVSENTDIIGEIKSGKCSRGNHNLALVDCVYLDKVKASLKLMIFTNKELCEYFRYNSQGLISKDIRTILVIPTVDSDAIVVQTQRSLIAL